MREKWEELYTKSQLLKLQEVEFESLMVIDDICRKLNITYFLYGGTLLGAYKYGGFIPWDDDVDIAMSRKDYCAFVKNASRYLPDNYVIQTPYNEKKSPFSYCKLRLKGTKYIEKFHHKLDIEQGIYIDIYPVDAIPDDEELRKMQFRKVQYLLKLYYYKHCLHADKDTPLIPKLKQVIAYFLLKLVPHVLIMSLIDGVLTKYNKKGCQRYSCLYYPNNENYYEKLFPLREVNFNGHKFKAPCDYENHLRRRYGNIDELPPVEKRIGHKPFIFSLGKYEDGVE